MDKPKEGSRVWIGIPVSETLKNGEIRNYTGYTVADYIRGQFFDIKKEGVFHNVKSWTYFN